MVSTPDLCLHRARGDANLLAGVVASGAQRRARGGSGAGFGPRDPGWSPVPVGLASLGTGALRVRIDGDGGGQNVCVGR